MRLLDLFCGGGGAAVGYHRAGFDEIVGVDIQPQPNYPFEFVQMDAIEFVCYMTENGYPVPDLVHASPPCQAYSTTKALHANAYPELIVPTRRLLQALRPPYVIENVVGAPLLNPIKLCGSSFGFRCSPTSVVRVERGSLVHGLSPRSPTRPHRRDGQRRAGR